VPEEIDDIDDDDIEAPRRAKDKGEAPRGRRRWVAYAVAGLLAVVVAGLLVVVLYPSQSSYAAVVNGVHITQTDLNDQLADVAANTKYVQLINQNGSSPVVGTKPGTYNKAFVAIVLNEEVTAEIIRQHVAAGKVSPSRAQVAAAKAVVSAQYPTGIFSSFRLRYQTVLETVQAEADAFVKLETAHLSTAGLKTYYQAHVNDYATEACVRHILIADLDASGQINYPASLTDADKIQAQLDAGGDFATLAMKYSQDNGQGGSAAQGGMLTGSAPDGCLTGQDLSQLVTPFAQAVIALPVNQISNPVKTQFGYHLIEVTKRVIEPLDSAVTADIRQQMAAVKLNQLVAQARIKINPTFGTFDKSPNPSTGQATGVVAPPGAASTTTTTQLSGG
jgi:foldase protein PrsA